jgi:hypothetical protein
MAHSDGSMSFAEVHAAHPWDEVLASVQVKTEADVLRALSRAEADSATWKISRR